MAVFYNYIKGLNNKENTLTYIYFPNWTNQFPSIKLVTQNNEKNLGQVVTTDGPDQIISKEVDIQKITTNSFIVTDIASINKLDMSSGTLTIGESATLKIGSKGEVQAGKLTVSNQQVTNIAQLSVDNIKIKNENFCENGNLEVSHIYFIQ